jgi:hypothetical protein
MDKVGENDRFKGIKEAGRHELIVDCEKASHLGSNLKVVSG